MTSSNKQRFITMKAKVVDGRGIATGKMKRLEEGLQKQQVKFYPGTLNLVLDRPISLRKDMATIQLEEQFLFWPMILNDTECMAHRFGQCPFHIVEVVAEHKLRDTIDVSDNLVEIRLNVKDVKNLSPLQHLMWTLAWKGREQLYYTSNTYAKFIGRLQNLRYKVNRYFGTHD